MQFNEKYKTKLLKANLHAKNQAKPKIRTKHHETLLAREGNMTARLMFREDPAPYCTGEGNAADEFKFIDLFAGIGGIRLGLERAGGKCVFSSEWDTDATKTYEAHFGDKPAGDITKIQNSDIPNHDILAGGFPCQAFSIMGGMKGFGDTRGTLFFEIERILRAKQPRAFLLENVRNLVSHDSGQTFKVILEHLRLLGYHVHWRILHALNFNFDPCDLA